MGILDKFTNIDDLLVSLIERIGGVTEEDTHFFSYPNDGTRATIMKGTTRLDFMGGTVMDTTGAVTPLGNSLRSRGREYCRSLSLQADRDITIQIGTKSKIPIFAGTWFKVAHLRFTDIKIITAESTRIFVIACTNPDSIEMAGETYIKDPADVWGQVKSMGLAELAVRTHAPPLMFDRRGDVIRWCDFESATEKWDSWSTGATMSRSNDYANTGDFSLKCYTFGNPCQTMMLMRTHDYHLGNIGLQVQFSAVNGTGEMLTTISHYTGAILYRYELRFDIDNNSIIYTGAGGDILIDTFDFYPSPENFSTAKLVVDLASHRAIRAVVFGKEYDLTGLACGAVVGANLTLAHLGTRITYQNAGYVVNTIYIDNVVITENEPI